MTNKREEQQVLVLPARVIPMSRMEVPYGNPFGHTLKIAIRNEAKKLPLYRLPVELDPHVTGRSNDGDIIPINILGRWVFGTPGFMGHIKTRFEDSEGKEAYVVYPEIKEVKKLLQQAIEKLGEGLGKERI